MIYPASQVCQSQTVLSELAGPSNARSVCCAAVRTRTMPSIKSCLLEVMGSALAAGSRKIAHREVSAGEGTCATRIDVRKEKSRASESDFSCGFGEAWQARPGAQDTHRVSDVASERPSRTANSQDHCEVAAGTILAWPVGVDEPAWARSAEVLEPPTPSASCVTALATRSNNKRELRWHSSRSTSKPF